MSLFSALANLFTRKKREDEWAKNFDQKPANPKNNLPLDPGNSSMT